MDVRGLLQFKKAEVESLTLVPSEKDVTASLVLSAELTPELAAKMRCRAAVFNAEDKPHAGITRLDLGEAKLRDIDLSLPSATGVEGTFDWYRPELIYGFRADIDGMIVRIHMRVRVKGRYQDLTDFVAQQNKDQFEVAIRSLQEEFDWTGRGGDGVRVEMNGAGKAVNVGGPLFNGSETEESKTELHPGKGCSHCDRGVPRNHDGMHMHEGELAECEASNVGGKQEATLPALHVVGSGRGPKQKRTRAQANQPTPEEIQQSVEAVEVVQ